MESKLHSTFLPASPTKKSPKSFKINKPGRRVTTIEDEVLDALLHTFSFSSPPEASNPQHHHRDSPSKFTSPYKKHVRNHAHAKGVPEKDLKTTFLLLQTRLEGSKVGILQKKVRQVKQKEDAAMAAKINAVFSSKLELSNVASTKGMVNPIIALSISSLGCKSTYMANPSELENVKVNEEDVEAEENNKNEPQYDEILASDFFNSGNFEIVKFENDSKFNLNCETSLGLTVCNNDDANERKLGNVASENTSISMNDYLHQNYSSFLSKDERCDPRDSSPCDRIGNTPIDITGARRLELKNSSTYTLQQNQDHEIVQQQSKHVGNHHSKLHTKKQMSSKLGSHSLHLANAAIGPEGLITISLQPVMKSERKMQQKGRVGIRRRPGKVMDEWREKKADLQFFTEIRGKSIPKMRGSQAVLGGHREERDNAEDENFGDHYLSLAGLSTESIFQLSTVNPSLSDANFDAKESNVLGEESFADNSFYSNQQSDLDYQRMEAADTHVAMLENDENHGDRPLVDDVDQNARIECNIPPVVGTELDTAESSRYLRNLEGGESIFGCLHPWDICAKYPNLKFTDSQMQELFNYPNIYYLGRDGVRAQKRNNSKGFMLVGKSCAPNISCSDVGGVVHGDFDGSTNNPVTHHTEKKVTSGFADEFGDYQAEIGDHLAFRYEILNTLGRGSFGFVYQCKDYKENKMVAIKVVRNKSAFLRQAEIEIDILNAINESDAGFEPSIDFFSFPSNHNTTVEADENLVKEEGEGGREKGTEGRKTNKKNHNCIFLESSFRFRGHICLVFPVYGLNLYEVMKLHKFSGFPMRFVRLVAIQLLQCLSYLREKGIIHCDLKPENILLRDENTAKIVVIDFGSSCKIGQELYSYIQSRFYRSPEVILGLNYGFEIDMWSVAALLPELRVAYPTFPGEDERDQLSCIVEVLGQPPKSMISRSSRRNVFSDQAHENDYEVSLKPSPRGRRRIANSKKLEDIVKARRNDGDFVDWLNKCLRWEPHERLTPDEALNHKWISKTAMMDLEGNSLGFSMRKGKKTRAMGPVEAAIQAEHSRKQKMLEPKNQDMNNDVAPNSANGMNNNERNLD